MQIKLTEIKVSKKIKEKKEGFYQTLANNVSSRCNNYLHIQSY